jgi:hypothetical protein
MNEMYGSARFTILGGTSPSHPSKLRISPANVVVMFVQSNFVIGFIALSPSSNLE